MKVIGLTGAAGSGKDTACGFALAWCEANGLVAERVALADPLKVSAARALGCPVEWSDEQCVEFCNELKQPDVQLRVDKYIPPNCGPEPVPPEWIPMIEISGRQFLQFYGTEAHRDVFGEDFWTNVSKKIITNLETAGVDVVFITDVRFNDEARFVLSEDDWDPEVWKIYRDAVEPIEAHSSEAGVDPTLVDLLVTNDGSLEDLRDGIRLSCNEQIGGGE